MTLPAVPEGDDAQIVQAPADTPIHALPAQMSGLGVRDQPAVARRVAWVFVAVGAIVLVALTMRFADLGQRALHHDESLHALFSYRFAEGKGYQHDPLMHGPLQFHLIGSAFLLLGAGDATARVPAAIFGTVLVAMPLLLLRRQLGDWGVVLATLLLAFSPSLLYYSRFARNEAFVACETLLLAVAIWRYREDGRFRWLVALSAAIALEFATKETAFLISAVFLLYVNGALTAVLLDRRGIEGRSRIWGYIAFFPFAWAIAALWPVLGERFGGAAPEDRPREVDLMVVMGTLVLPFLAAGLQIPLSLAGIEVSARSERLVGGLLVSGLIVISGELGVWWDWRRWAILAAIMYGITILLFTTFFTNPAGFAGAFWTQLDYWLAQQAVQRGTQPAYYYAFLVPLYEMVSLLPAAIGGVILLWKGDRFARLLAWWGFGTFAALSGAGEKMPWLTVHIALPLAILAAYALGRGIEAIRDRGNARDLPLVVAPAALVMGLLFALAVRNGALVAYAHPDTPLEPLIYTQTSPDIPAIARQLDAIAAERGGRDRVTIVVDASESMSWPWAWYLRDYKNATYVDHIDTERIPGDAILLVWDGTLSALSEIRGRYPVAEEYTHRWWFPEEGYRSWTRASLGERIDEGTLLPDLAGFIWSGEQQKHLGTLDGLALFPEAPPAITMPTTGEHYGR
ncbi:MAG: TIGR03663 family protein [Dehalococcoidia bacterium]